jgi:5-methyltetrahydropteroyltriglutamate--homocysteine methyltransferase
VLQVDDAWLAALWDRIGIKMGLPAYKSYCALRVAALNHALRNVPPEQVRYHLCWGSWHGPHSHDIPLADLVDAPGVVSHSTPLIEHPELVAMHIRRFADIVGRERVIASTDCGLGLRCHPQIAWAKLKALSEGAALASQSLWGRRAG